MKEDMMNRNEILKARDKAHADAMAELRAHGATPWFHSYARLFHSYANEVGYPDITIRLDWS